MRVASVRAARRKLVKLFKKPNSKFYWYDFMVRGHRYRGSTQEAKSVRAVKAASLKLASVIQDTDPLPSKATALCEFAERFLAWVDDGRLEEKTKKFYRNGWRLLKATPVAGLRVNQITGDFAEQFEISQLSRERQLRFADVATNAPQSGGVEDDRSRSENQNDEGAWAASSA
jgi:hypothetical protein